MNRISYLAGALAREIATRIPQPTEPERQSALSRVLDDVRRAPARALLAAGLVEALSDGFTPQHVSGLIAEYISPTRPWSGRTKALRTGAVRAWVREESLFEAMSAVTAQGWSVIYVGRETGAFILDVSP